MQAIAAVKMGKAEHLLTIGAMFPQSETQCWADRWAFNPDQEGRR
jgi:hypothetical protein